MSLSAKNTICLLSLILTIYFLRQADQSPSSFLKHHIARIAQEQNLSERFCSKAGNYDNFSQSQRDRADNLRHGVQNVRGDESLTKHIQSGQPRNELLKDYAESYIPFMLPWLILFVIGLLGFVVCACNYCCMNCWPCNRVSWRCCKPPKTNNFANGYAIVSLVLMALTVGSGIAGIIFVNPVTSQSNGVMCSTARLLEKINDGSSGENWVGVTAGLNTLDTAVSNIRKAVNDMSQLGVIFNDLDTNLNESSAIIDSVYDDSRGVTLNSVSTGDAYTPEYITRIGPKTTLGTFTYSLNLETAAKQTVIDNGQQAFNSFRDDVTQKANQVIDEVEQNRPTLNLVADYSNQASRDIADNSDTINTVINVINGVVLGLSIANVAVAVLAILSIVMVCVNYKGFNRGITFSWCLIGLLMLVGWLVATFLFALGIGAFESCDVGDGIVADPVFFNQTFDKLNTIIQANEADYNRTRNVLYTCLHGDGDLSTEFNVRSNIPVLEGIFAQANVQYASANANISRLAPSPFAASQIEFLRSFRDGNRPESQTIAQDLATLNSLTNSNSNDCTSVDDTWALGSVSCDNSIPVFQTSNQSTAYLDSPTCIGFDSWMNNANHNIATRYQEPAFPTATCDPVGNQAQYLYLQDYVDKFVANRRQNRNITQTLMNGIGDFEAKTQDFVTEAKKIPPTIVSINGTLATIYDSIADPNTGIIANSNCKFIKSSLNEVLDATCTGAAATVYSLGIIYLAMSFITMLATFFLFCLSKRFTKPEAQKVTQLKYAK